VGKSMLLLLLPIEFLGGCGQQKFTTVPQNPSFIIVTKYQDYYQGNGGAAPTAQVVTTEPTMNQIVNQINLGGNHVIPKNGSISCPSANTDVWYDIVIHYPNSGLTFTLNDVGCTFLYDEKDGITLYDDIPTVAKLFQSGVHEYAVT